MKRNELRELSTLSISELNARADNLRRELFSIRLHTSTRPVKDTASYRRMKKDIARVLTVIRQKQASV